MHKADESSIQGRTKSGMDYYILPQKDFGEKMAAVLVKAGANHIFWKTPEGEQIEFPQGIAHFIEHKLFQQKWGDAFTELTRQGAVANAFTDGEKTVYYFSCRESFMDNLKLLLDFVQNPYFTEEDTEKEKSIITSEITMYDDDPSWVVYYQMLEAMYGKHPIKNPVAGSAKTVGEVTAESLQAAYDAYYTTESIKLICTGDIPVKRVQMAAESVKKRETELQPFFPEEEDEILEKYRERKMGLQCPMFQIGFKLPPVKKGERLRQRVAMGFVLELLAGESSPFFQKAYEKEFLDEPMGAAYFCGEGYAFATFTATGRHPEEVAELLGKELERLKRDGFAWEDFQRIRKKMLGRFLRRLDSVNSLCMGQIEWAMEDATAAEMNRLIKSMPKEDAEKLLQNALSVDTMVLSVVR
ncbi:MAG: insulinase family protein [Anaerotignum sp.]|nr:insulinase family protein [Anaerotignum sp.]